MINFIYKPANSRIWRWKFRQNPTAGTIEDISLETPDKQGAEKLRTELLQEKLHESAGLLPAKSLRDAAQATLTQHFKDFIGDLRAKGRNQQYVAEFENRLLVLMHECTWHLPKDITADSFVKWRSAQTKAAKTLNEYLAAAKGFCNWMMRQGRILVNPLIVVQSAETRGKEVRKRRAYSDEEMQALLNVAGKHRILYVMAALTGIRHGELKKLRWGDINLSAEKPSVTVRASLSKNHKLACLPLHPSLVVELLRYRPVDFSSGDLVFGKLVLRSDKFCKHLDAAGISKRDSIGRVVDFHSFRHTFCTYLHRAGVPLREAMELMRHSDVRLTMEIYADSSLFALRPAVEKLPWNYLDHSPQPASQIASQNLGAPCHSAALLGTEYTNKNAVKTIENKGQMSLFDIAWRVLSQIEKWCAIQGSNL